MGLLALFGLGASHLQNAGRIRDTTQEVRQLLAGARTAIEAHDLTLARQRVAEAQARLGGDRASLGDLATDIDSLQQETETRQADQDRLQEFLRLTSEAEEKMSHTQVWGGDRLAGKALDLYGILADNDWLLRLEATYLTTNQKTEVRENAYVALVGLADYWVRWDNLTNPETIQRSLNLLQSPKLS